MSSGDAESPKVLLLSSTHVETVGVPAPRDTLSKVHQGARVALRESRRLTEREVQVAVVFSVALSRAGDQQLRPVAPHNGTEKSFLSEYSLSVAVQERLWHTAVVRRRPTLLCPCPRKRPAAWRLLLVAVLEPELPLAEVLPADVARLLRGEGPPLRAVEVQRAVLVAPSAVRPGPTDESREGVGLRPGGPQEGHVGREVGCPVVVVEGRHAGESRPLPGRRHAETPPQSTPPRPPSEWVLRGLLRRGRRPSAYVTSARAGGVFPAEAPVEVDPGTGTVLLGPVKTQCTVGVALSRVSLAVPVDEESVGAGPGSGSHETQETVSDALPHIRGPVP